MSSRVEKRFNNYRTIFDAVFDSVKNFPDKAALIDDSDGRVAYIDIKDRVERLAGGLHKAGINKGDRVGIISENCCRWGISYLAIQTAGGVVVPFDPVFKRGELADLLRVSEIKFLFCSEKWHLPLTQIIDFDKLDIELISLFGEGEKKYSSLLKSESFVDENVSPNDPAAIIYTSGTTGTPKGVILTHGNILANIDSVSQALPFYDNDVFLSLLPLHHTLEATCGFLVPLVMGLTVFYAGSLKSRDVIDKIKSNGVTVMVAVPLVYEKFHLAIKRRLRQLPFMKRVLLDSFYKLSSFCRKFNLNPGKVLFKGLRRQGGLDSIRMFISGGAPLPSHIGKWFNAIGLRLLEGYGMTECSPVLAVNRPENICIGSVGPPLPDIEIKINEPNDDGIGEVIVRGGNTTPGYLNNPEATAELLRDGWLYTGDMGKIEKGLLFITGRSKNIIISGGGKNIFPEEIEGYLNQSDYVLESLAVGRMRSGKTGEEIWALIVPDREQFEMELAEDKKVVTEEKIKETITEIVKDVNSRLADYKRIVNFEIRNEEFEKTAAKKIKRTKYK
jgi:long-chain acyl-CoA synthetase